jgi:inner membrane transporter RhtA
VHRTTPESRVPAPVLVLISIASVQTGAAVARTAFDDAGAMGITLMRLAFSAALMVAVLRPAPWRWSRDAQLSTLVFGLTLAGMNMVFYLALRTVPLGVCVTVEFLGPLAVALAQTRRWRDLCWVILAGGGVALLGLRGGEDVPVGGLLLALTAGACWGVYIFASAKVGRVVPGAQGLATALVIAAVVALPFGSPGVAGVLDRPAVLLVGLTVAVLSSIIPYGCELAALRRMPTRVFGVLMSLEPAAAAIAGLVVLDQALDGREVLALVLVSVASFGITLGPPPRPTEMITAP